MEIVKLIGSDVLPEDQKLTHGDRPRHPVGFLQQNAYHPRTRMCRWRSSCKMMQVISYLNRGCKAADFEQGRIPVSLITRHRHLRGADQDEVRCAQRTTFALLDGYPDKSTRR
jgi:V/A-type H+-transporting ATPase subunit A